MIVPGFSASTLVSPSGSDPSHAPHLRDEVKLRSSLFPIPTADLRSSRPLRQMAEPLISLQEEVKLCSPSHLTPIPNLCSSLQPRQMAEHAILISDLCSSSQLRQAAELLIPPSSLRDEVKLLPLPSCVAEPPRALNDTVPSPPFEPLYSTTSESSSISTSPRSPALNTHLSSSPIIPTLSDLPIQIPFSLQLFNSTPSELSELTNSELGHPSPPVRTTFNHPCHLRSGYSCGAFQTRSKSPS
ncbi:hypothetical protein PTTG_30819 [Puccinia triticina 1-1 BBBD Race 1]|uniref:Uncharacterized protein n=1 Tax=Puccinia triticina (isolate 1-1 / race 1 (BBBD)) TaxID=630390 RepID=A0A180FXT0_PUCT1|nr:hypothetical protein PTTG_30819 [Puccinia triticina 1-1 BBBD Race 1]